jgi:protein SCO1/2
MKSISVSLVAFSLSISFALAQENIPGDSVYQLGGTWQTQDEKTIELRNLAGKTQVVAMIYTNCQHVCPVIVSSMKSIQKSLPEDISRDTEFILVTFTPNMDTPRVMREYFEMHQLDPDNWTFLRGSPDQVRDLAMVLGIRYRILDNNEVNHANLISVLDDRGRLEFQGSGALSEAHAISSELINN